MSNKNGARPSALWARLRFQMWGRCWPRLPRKASSWVELEYNRATHSELGESPLDAFLHSPDVGRPSPESAALRSAFRMEQQRTPRRSDGTISVEGRRLELPGRYRTMLRPTIRYARWDLSEVELVDARTGAHLCPLYPLDKQRNASGRRNALDPITTTKELRPVPESGVAPLLDQLIAEYSATSLPPAYHSPNTAFGFVSSVHVMSASSSSSLISRGLSR